MNCVPTAFRKRSGLKQAVVMGGVLLAGVLAACGTPGRNVPVELASTSKPLAARLVALEVGRLLSADGDASLAAERRLTTLDVEGQKALQEYARRIPSERDPRWLNVLEENHALPPLPPDEDLEYLLWKVSRAESFFVMKAQSRLLDMARVHPDLMLARLDRGGRGTEAIAVALALAGETRAVLPLLLRYERARSLDERRVAAEALAHLVGDDLRPRLQGNDDEIRRDAGAIRKWLRAHRGNSR